jgi:DNA primase
MNPDFEAIKKAADIVRVVESCGVALKKVGADHVGLCPFHEDKKPSLRVTRGKGLFRCPACGAAGNAIQFVAKKEGISERQAAIKLCASIPGVVRGSEMPTAGKEEPSAVDEATRARLLARVVKFYAATLHKDRAGLDYLASRKLADGALLEAFQVGYCNGSLRSALPRGGEVVGQLKEIGILNERGNEVFFGRVVVPIFCPAGNVVGLYGRRCDDAEPRHLYLRGGRRGVFHAAAASRGPWGGPRQTAEGSPQGGRAGGTPINAGPCLIVTEAIFDAMSWWVAGHRNAIALYGKDGWTADHQRLLESSGVTEVVLALDNDERGREAADALETKLAGLVKSIRRVEWPEGAGPDGRIKDANAFLLSRGPAAFAALLAPEPSAQSVETPASESEAIEMSEGGFTALYGCRRYELCAIERPSAAKLRATVKARNGTVGGFHIDTVDFYLSRSRRGFVSEAARMFRETSEVIEGDVNRIIAQLENYVAQRLEEKNPMPSLVAEADQHEAQRLGRSHDLIAEIQSDLEKLGLVGERANRLLLYFAMTSRKMDDPLAVQILSGSGAGKSHLQDAVLSLCPEEDLIKLTSLSGQALFYKGEDSLRHKCLAIAEVAGAEGARYALRNLISEKKLVIESTIKSALTGRLETQLNTVHGPTAVFETTTNPNTDPETKSRYLLLSVDESPEQTSAILAMQRQSHTLDGMKRRRRREAVRRCHHAFQRLLKPLVVVNPFEPLLRYGEDGRLLFRRDHPKYLQLILVVTFVHQMQRVVKHDEEIGDYIETTLDDIAIANDLAAGLFGQSLDDLSSPSRDLLRLIRDYVAARATENRKQPQAVEFSRRELLGATGWSYYRLRVHLGELVEHEYLAPASGRFGQRFVYRLLAPAEESRFTPGLKTVEQLRREAGTLQPCGGSENLAGTLRGCSRKVGSPAEAGKHKANGNRPANLAGFGEELIGGVAS